MSFCFVNVLGYDVVRIDVRVDIRVDRSTHWDEPGAADPSDITNRQQAEAEPVIVDQLLRLGVEFRAGCGREQPRRPRRALSLAQMH